jgi:hypothetical protein
MNVVMITCPQTGRSVSTGIEIDPATFATLPHIPAQMRCSACGGDHVWSKEQAWLVDGSTEYLKEHP